MTKSQAPAFRVLVIDDNVDAAKVLSLLLSKRGNEVQALYNGADALRAAGEFRPDCIISDIGMPGVDGYEVARRFRADARFNQIPLIALTAYSNTAETNEAGFDYHIVKAQPISSILSLIEQVKALSARVKNKETASDEQSLVLIQAKGPIHEVKDDVQGTRTELAKEVD
ncbi:hypothetical protein AYO47_02905 [Planctomyces sp. SCGC AG-212-M04]|nr:hypothetical protein AYO47_02905 [Planctomyces sp. SCGC AG-212-M04]